MNTLLTAVLVLMAGYPVLWWFFDRLRRGDIRAAVQKQQDQQERLFQEGTRLLTEQLAALQIEVERAREIASAADAKTGRYFAQLEVFEKQRNHWNKLYFDQAVGHGNAQTLMMNTIEHLARDLSAKGGRPSIPKALHAVRQEFQEHHELPAREGLAALKAKEQAAPAASEAPSEAPTS